MQRRRFSAEFKRKVVLEAMRGDEAVRVIAARHKIYPYLLNDLELMYTLGGGGRQPGRPGVCLIEIGVRSKTCRRI